VVLLVAALGLGEGASPLLALLVVGPRRGRRVRGSAEATGWTSAEAACQAAAAAASVARPQAARVAHSTRDDDGRRGGEPPLVPPAGRGEAQVARLD
jgi:hypothetical protein